MAAAAAAAAPVIGGIYDDFDDNRHEQLLLNDSGSTAGILYFTGDEVYKEYCSEMNAWVSPVAGRNEYIRAKGMLESFTVDLPDIKLVLNFLVNNYSNRINDLLINYECILYDTKSAKFDFAFYYMVECFLRTVEENAAASAAALAAPVAAALAAPPAAAALAAPVAAAPVDAALAAPVAAALAAPDSPPSGSGGRGGNTPPDSAARTVNLRSPVSITSATRLGGISSKPRAIQFSSHGSSEEGGSSEGENMGTPLPQPDPKKPNLSPPVIKKLIRYLHNLYKGPEELIFDEEITQFHIALLIKYMN